jgi:hypothetical protein
MDCPSCFGVTCVDLDDNSIVISLTSVCRCHLVLDVSYILFYVIPEEGRGGVDEVDQTVELSSSKILCCSIGEPLQAGLNIARVQLRSLLINGDRL